MLNDPRKIYVCGVLAWIAIAFLFPVWEGRSYHNLDGPWRSSGSFGSPARAPIWNPHPGRVTRRPPVRWPFQAPSQTEHVEIWMRKVCAQCSLGIILLGFLCGLVPSKDATRRPELFSAVVVSLSLGLILAWVSLFLLAAMSMGYATTDTVVLFGFAIGLGIGLIVGVSWHGRQLSKWRERVAVAP